MSTSLICDGNDNCGDLSDEIYNSTGDACTSVHILDCNFEAGDTCNWINVQNWRTQTGASHSLNTGPAYDHTHRAQGDLGKKED